MLAFNFFFLPPAHTFRLEERSNWVALAVYVVTGVVVSELASRARDRAAEAESANKKRHSSRSSRSRSSKESGSGRTPTRSQTRLRAFCT